MYGVSISIPVFDGLQTHYKTQQAKLKLQKTENDMESLQLAIDLQIQSSQISLKNSLAAMDSQKKNMELAEEVLTAAKTKYKQGVGTSLEVTTAETSLLEAQTNYFNALYDALVSKVDYDKANGNIK
jgi:outer membrane protein TolC